MAVSKQPSITPETSSGEGLDEEQASRGETKWKRFHPFRVVRKIFRRRVKRQGTGEETESSKKSWSTSELQSVHDVPNKYEAPSPPYKIGLSVSHDSIFSPESSNFVSSEELDRPQGSSLSMQHAGIKNMFKDELFSRVRARRDSDDDDVGLPHSPCTSPTTVDVLDQGLKSKSLKSQTTCSAGSLISMCSSENDEDSALASSSGNSSRMSLLDRRSIDFEGDPDLYQPVPLNHQAAHHRIAVRPKRTHGLPQKRLKQLAASKLSTLPATPEVTEYLKAEATTTVITSTASMHQISKYATSSSRENTFVLNTSEKVLSESKSATELSQSLFDKQELHNIQQTFYDSMLSVENRRESDILRKDLSPSENNETKSCNQPKSDATTNDTQKISPIDHHALSMEIHQSLLKTSEQFQHFSDHRKSVEENHNTSEHQTFIQESASESKVIEETRQQIESSESDLAVRVSALIKNIEKSEAGIKSHKTTPVQENIEPMHDETNIHDINFGANTVENKISAAPELKSEAVNLEQLEKCAPTDQSEKSSSLNRPLDLGSRLSNICLSDFKSSKSTANSDTHLSPRSLTNDNKTHAQEQNKIEQEIKQQFQQQKIITTRHKNVETVANTFPEEESIMSDKSVPSPKSETVMHNNSKVSISHHIPCNSTIQHEKLIEARNTEISRITKSTDETYNFNVQGVANIVDTSPMQNHNPYISSLNISQNSDNTDVTINSLTSNVFNQKLTEDRVTIAVNSNNLKSSTKVPTDNKTDLVITNMSKNTEKPTSTKPALPSQAPNLKNKVANKKPEVKKSPSPESSTRSPYPKNVTQSKKVSVEIVPFSQRMKEKTYQPLAFSNKNSTEISKLSSSVAVERNLSERRIISKGKEAEKANNRHSFSGALPAEIERHLITSSTDKKSTPKADKLHYPVQIRIHKGKVDEKENKCENQNKSNDGRLHPEMGKPTKEVKPLSDVSAKWEVKVQTSQSKESILSQQEIRKALSESKSIINKATNSEEFQNTSHLVSNSEDAQEKIENADNISRNKEGVRKSHKDSSKDSEPELLRVFARRSIEQKHCDKDKLENKADVINNQITDNPPPSNSVEYCNKTSESSLSSPVPNSSAKLSDNEETQPSVSPDIMRRKSKSFSDKEKPLPQVITPPLKDASIVRRPSLKTSSPELSEMESFHRRQRTASEPEVLTLLPPVSDAVTYRNYQNNSLEKSVLMTCRSEHLQRTSSVSLSPGSALPNGTSNSLKSDLDKGKDNPDPSAPSWLQLAQQRREMREQRERLLLGSTTNSFLDASSKPSRSSKVWDMVNNFQKLQMT